MSGTQPARRALARLQRPCSLCLSSSQRGISSAARLRKDDQGKPSRPQQQDQSAKPPAPRGESGGFVPNFITPYTAEEKAQLREKYSPAQMRIIELAEAKIKEEELRDQGMLRRDKFSMPYFDDFAHIEPFKDLRAPQKNTVDPNARLKTDEEMEADVQEWMKQYLESPISADEGPNAVDPSELLEKFEEEFRFTVGSEEAERNPVTYLSQTVPKFSSEHVEYREESPLSHEQLRLFRESPVGQNMVARDLKMRTLHNEMVRNQTRMGKTMAMRAIAVAGNGKGLLGIGEGKADIAPTASTSARIQAAKNMVPIPLYEGRTIYGTVTGKVGGVEVELRARPPGFGLRCHGILFEICKMAGISDLSAKVTRGRNKMNVAKATWEALKKQRVPSEMAKARGVKLVDVRAVYYSGAAAPKAFAERDV